MPEKELARIAAYFAPPAYETLEAESAIFEQNLAEHADFARWVDTNIVAHKMPAYAIVNISLKPIGGIPGDASSTQMRAIADIARRYGLDEIRVTHEQNLVLPHVKKDDLKQIYDLLLAQDLATP